MWLLRYRGRVRKVRREELRAGLVAGWLTGVEFVRREDGDWGPLFGRPVYREVFAGEREPRDHALERARLRVRTLEWRTKAGLLISLLLVVVALPGISGRAGEAALIGASIAAVCTGMSRLFAAIHRHELQQVERAVRPTELPPPEVDWAAEAARDEVEAALRDRA